MLGISTVNVFHSGKTREKHRGASAAESGRRGNWKYDLTPDFLRNLGLEMNRRTSEAVVKTSYSISHRMFDTTPNNAVGKIVGPSLDQGVDMLYEIYEKNGGTESLATGLKNAAGEISRTDTALDIHEKIKKTWLPSWRSSIHTSIFGKI